MRIYYSGEQGIELRPEKLLGKKARVMLSFYNSRKKVEARFHLIHTARKKALKGA